MPGSCLDAVPEDTKWNTKLSKSEHWGAEIWGAFAESNFWFGNLNWTFILKPSSQVNNFTVFFHFFMGMSKSMFSICLG
jgi:hypothetical protein